MTSSIQARSLWINLHGSPRADTDSLVSAQSSRDVSQLRPEGCATTLAPCWVAFLRLAGVTKGTEQKAGQRDNAVDKKNSREWFSDFPKVTQRNWLGWQQGTTMKSNKTNLLFWRVTNPTLSDLGLESMLRRQSIPLLFFLNVLAATLPSLCFPSWISLWFSLFHHQRPGWSVRYQWGRWVQTEGMQVLEEARLPDSICVSCWRLRWCWHTGLFLLWYYPGV